jgi:GR25 family glycosyltransferase involved in LPS biosynthesis
VQPPPLNPFNVPRDVIQFALATVRVFTERVTPAQALEPDAAIGHVYLITLAGDWERQAVMKQTLRFLNVPASICYMSRPTPDVYASYSRWQSPSGSLLSRGELGCAMSHLNVLHAARMDAESSATPSKPILILEDDAFLHQGFHDRLRTLTRDPLFSQSDVVLLGASDWHRHRRGMPGTDSPRQVLYRCGKEGVCGTFAYVVQPNALTRLCHLFSALSRPADHNWALMHTALAVAYPDLVIPDRTTSSLRAAFWPNSPEERNYISLCLLDAEADTYNKVPSAAVALDSASRPALLAAVVAKTTCELEEHESVLTELTGHTEATEPVHKPVHKVRTEHTGFQTPGAEVLGSSRSHPGGSDASGVSGELGADGEEGKDRADGAHEKRGEGGAEVGGRVGDLSFPGASLDDRVKRAIATSTWSAPMWHELLRDISACHHPTPDMAVCMCVFNPVGFTRPVENAVRAINACSPFPVYVVELVYSDIPLCRPMADVLRARTAAASVATATSSCVLFHKENLWNLVERLVPPHFSKLLFLDADILFAEPTWYGVVSALLDTHAVVQPYRTVSLLNARGDPYRTIPSMLALASTRAKEKGNIFRSPWGAPGFGIACRRDWLHTVGGLFDAALMGGGDLLQLAAVRSGDGDVSQFPAWSKQPYAHALWHGYAARVRAAAKARPGLFDRSTFAPLHISHLFHGPPAGRQYASRHERMQFMAAEEFAKNAEGVWEALHVDDVNAITLPYFRDRREDDDE